MSNFKDLHRKLVLEASDLIIGETLRDLECPKCGKGDGDFSITRIDEGLLYNCFRASCGFKGFIPGFTPNLPLEEVEKRAEQKQQRTKIKEFKYDTEPLNKTQLWILSNKYHLSENTIKEQGWVWCQEQGRLVMPIFNERGQRTGVLARYLKELSQDVIPFDVTSKTLFYWEKENEHHLHFPRLEINPPKKGVNGKIIYVLVEDIPSACCIQAMGHQAVALLGSTITKDALPWFYDKNVAFALDPDATDKALKYQKQYSLLFKSCQVLPLNKDPKDMTQEEIIENINRQIKVV